MKKDAKGLEGFLLIYPDFSTAVPTGAKEVECKNTIIAFRVYEYDENGKHKYNEKGIIFKDYKIRHHDLRVKLLDGVLTESEEGNYLDYK